MFKKTKKLVLYTAVTGFFLSLANKVIFYLALVKELLSTKSGNFYEWRFGKVFYTKKGAGSPLLLIHDLQADSSGYEWSRAEKALSKTHTVYTVDLPGCGRSQKPALTYTNFLYVQFLEAFVRDVIRDPAAIAATGASCSFVIHYASQNPDLVSKLFLINPLSFSAQATFPDKTAKLYKKLVCVPVIGTCIYNYQVSIKGITEKFRETYFYDKRKCAANLINAYYEAAHTGGSDCRYLYASIAAGYTNMPVSHVMNKLTMPVTVAGGEEECDLESTLHDFCRLQPAIQAKIIPGTRHLPQLEKPEKVTDLMEEFLQA